MSESLEKIIYNVNGRISKKLYRRVSAETIVYKDRFELDDHEYARQYFELYRVRLKELKPRVLTAAKRKWQQYNPFFADRMIDLKQGDLSFVIGTVYIKNGLKSRALDEINGEDWPLLDVPCKKLARDTDQMVLEDDSGVIKLVREEGSCQYLVTGMVVGILGIESSTGAFMVRDVCLPAPTIPQPTMMKDVEEHKYVAFISGVEASQLNHPHRLYSLLDFINGSSGCEAIQEFSSRITRIIIAGNTFPSKPNTSRELRNMSLQNRKYGVCKERLADMELIDDFLNCLGKTINVDILPGKSDPVAPALPQQPLSPCLFPLASKLSTVNWLSNPALLSVDDVKILGTSGNNIDDLYKYSTMESRIKLAHLTLLCSHIAPTAPDTLWCYPFINKDKLVLESWPNIYFIGNQPSYEYKLVQQDNFKTLILLIPPFHQQPSAILVNLTTLEPIIIEFSESALAL